MSPIIKTIILLAFFATFIASIYSTPIQEKKSAVLEKATATVHQILDESSHIQPLEHEPLIRVPRTIRMFRGSYNRGRPGYGYGYRRPSLLGSIFDFKRRIVGALGGFLRPRGWGYGHGYGYYG